MRHSGITYDVGSTGAAHNCSQDDQSHSTDAKDRVGVSIFLYKVELSSTLYIMRGSKARIAVV